jgi:hypothetical protein
MFKATEKNLMVNADSKAAHWSRATEITDCRESMASKTLLMTRVSENSRQKIAEITACLENLWLNHGKFTASKYYNSDIYHSLLIQINFTFIMMN